MEADRTAWFAMLERQHEVTLTGSELYDISEALMRYAQQQRAEVERLEGLRDRHSAFSRKIHRQMRESADRMDELSDQIWEEFIQPAMPVFDYSTK